MLQNLNRLLTDEELAKFLKISPGTLRHYRYSGSVKIPYIRVGGSIRYRIEDVLAYLDSKVVGDVA